MLEAHTVKITAEINSRSDIKGQPDTFTAEITAKMTLEYPVVNHWYGKRLRVLTAEDIDMRRVEEAFYASIQSKLREQGKRISSEAVEREDYKIIPESNRLVISLHRLVVIRPIN